MSKKQFTDELWVEITENQAEKLLGGGVINPGGQELKFDELPGNGDEKGQGKAKDNWIEPPTKR